MGWPKEVGGAIYKVGQIPYFAVHGLPYREPYAPYLTVKLIVPRHHTISFAMMHGEFMLWCRAETTPHPEHHQRCRSWWCTIANAVITIPVHTITLREHK